MTEESGKPRTEDLRIERLVSGDRTSVYALGMTGAHALRQFNVAVFMADVLGRVHLVNPEAVQVLRRPRVIDEDLDNLPEGAAINAMIEQGDDEKTIIDYLKRRAEKEVSNGG